MARWDRDMLQRFVKNYLDRHRHPLNQLLHVVGVPLTFAVSVAALIAGSPWWALGAFVAGYALQFAGHAIEGNDAGEVVLVKKILGRPYTEFGPDRKPPSATTSGRFTTENTESTENRKS